MSVPDYLADRRVLVTGHSGFIGSWLCQTLVNAGAKVWGASLPTPVSQPAMADVIQLDGMIESAMYGDIVDASFCERLVRESQPEFIVHLAAQPLVIQASADPLATYATNVMGTANLFQALLASDVRSHVLCFTTDKVYASDDRAGGCTETSPLGGTEAYGVSKACAELIAGHYRAALGPDRRVATLRAGNVIGGGDWAENRLVPDAFRAWQSDAELELRMPDAIRPWQHVLEVVSACLLVLRFLDTPGRVRNHAWNVGPTDAKTSVGQLIQKLVTRWPDCPSPVINSGSGVGVKEAMTLVLDCTQIASDLGWRTVLSDEAMLDLTASWYAQYRVNVNQIPAVTSAQIEHYFGINAS